MHGDPLWQHCTFSRLSKPFLWQWPARAHSCCWRCFGVAISCFQLEQMASRAPFQAPYHHLSRSESVPDHASHAAFYTVTIKCNLKLEMSCTVCTDSISASQWLFLTMQFVLKNTQYSSSATSNCRWYACSVARLPACLPSVLLSLFISFLHSFVLSIFLSFFLSFFWPRLRSYRNQVIARLCQTTPKLGQACSSLKCWPNT